jgi:hypothetical protein
MQKRRLEMKNAMLKIFLVVILVSLALCIPCVAYADTVPTPLIEVHFSGLQDKEIIATLLFPYSNIGSYTEWGEKSDESKKDAPAGQDDAWEAFYAFEDPDGYHFLQSSQIVSESSSLRWQYHSPKTFKVLVYIPSSGDLLVSDKILETRGFYNIYSADLSHTDNASFAITKQSSFPYEIAGFALRLCLTLLIELLVAAAFGLCSRKSIPVIIIVNVITQVILTIYATVVLKYPSPMLYGYGPVGAIMYWYVELGIVCIEAIIYAIYYGRKIGYKKPIVYAVVANLISWLLGSWIAWTLPIAF